MILYHGTNSRKDYKSILKNGFNKGTYFTQYLNSAISYGGKYIFAIDGELYRYRGQWEYICNSDILPNKILYIQKYSLRLKYVNDKLMSDLTKKRFESEGKEICINCNGMGEHRKAKYDHKYLGSLKMRKDAVVVCNVCKGFGYKL